MIGRRDEHRVRRPERFDSGSDARLQHADREVGPKHHDDHVAWDGDADAFRPHCRTGAGDDPHAVFAHRFHHPIDEVAIGEWRSVRLRAAIDKIEAVIDALHIHGETLKPVSDLASYRLAILVSKWLIKLMTS
mgnify:CR=1 FL=1